MTAPAPRARMARLSLLLFAFGAAVHLAILWSYLPVYLNIRSFLAHPLTQLEMGILGETTVLVAGRALLRQKLSGQHSFMIVANGALYGMLATLLTLQAMFILGALSASIGFADKGYPNASFFDGFFVSMISIQTYGLAIMLGNLPFAVVYGSVLGGIVALAGRYVPPGSLSTHVRAKHANASILLGLVGILLFWLPIPGGALNALAVIFGVVSLQRIKKGEETGKGKATIRLTLGSIGLVGLVVVLSYPYK